MLNIFSKNNPFSFSNISIFTNSLLSFNQGQSTPLPPTTTTRITVNSIVRVDQNGVTRVVQ